MSYITNRKVIQSIQLIIQYLVSEDLLDKAYEGDTEGLQEAIETYPSKISIPPISEFETIEKLDFPTEEGDKDTYTAEPSLWYSGEESDLYLRIFCKEKMNDDVEVYLYAIPS